MSKVYIGDDKTEFNILGEKKIILNSFQQEELKDLLTSNPSDEELHFLAENEELKEKIKALENRLKGQEKEEEKNAVDNAIAFLELVERHNEDLTIKEILKKDDYGIQEINICEDRDDLRDFVKKIN